MRFSELLKSAFSSIWSRKVRSFLTSLGVIIGVFAVSALLSVGQASINQMNENMEDLNANLIDIGLYSQDIKMSLGEVTKIEGLNGVKKAAPYISNNAEIIKGSNQSSPKVVGTTQDWTDIKDIKMNRGRFLSHVDVENKSKSVVLGLTICLEMFGNTDVIGEEVFIDGIKYVVIGVVDEMKSSFISNANKEIYVPITTMQINYNIDSIGNVSVLPKENMVKQANNELKSFLSKKYPSKNDYYVSSDENIQEYIIESNKIMMALLGGIGGISLLVSGIGIMNIMLVSVRERTKEIGIRKAVGAKRKDIMIQFLIEAMGLSLFGGIMGIILTAVTSRFLGSALNMQITMESWIIMLSTIFSLVVGIIFGLYPAMKASALRPVEALHYE